MGRDIEFIPRTYSIKGYTRKGRSLGGVLKFVAYAAGILALVTVISIFLMFAF